SESLSMLAMRRVPMESRGPWVAVTHNAKPNTIAVLPAGLLQETLVCFPIVRVLGLEFVSSAVFPERLLMVVRPLKEHAELVVHEGVIRVLTRGVTIFADCPIQVTLVLKRHSHVEVRKLRKLAIRVQLQRLAVLCHTSIPIVLMRKRPSEGHVSV